MQDFSLLKQCKRISVFSLLMVLLFTGSLLFFSSCKPTKHSTVFMSLPKDTSIRSYVDVNMNILIRKHDILAIEVSSLNREMDERFNAAATAGTDAYMGQRRGYQVNDSGFISVHYAGQVRAAGYTAKELAKVLQDSLAPYMKEPLVQVQFLNHRVTVMGEVGNPKVVSMSGDPMTLLEAIVGSGDMKENADKSNIMVIRDSSDVKLVRHVNLEKHDVIASPWFYMQPNDIVYVMPKSAKADKEERKRTLQTTLSLAASAMSLLIIILSRL